MSTKTRRALVLCLVTLAAALAIAAQARTLAGEGGGAGEVLAQAPRGKSEQEVLLQDPLFAIPGKQAHLLRIEYPPGWVGQRHYHTGDVFLYVLEGSFTIDVEGKQTTIGAGEAYHEAVKAVMQARNPSASEPTRLLLFQVGNTGERLTVITD